MKMTCWLFLSAMLSTGLLAQQATDAPPAAPIQSPELAPALTNAPSPTQENSTNAPATKAPKRKHSPRKHSANTARKKDPAAELRTVPLVAGPAVVDANHVNVRGQAKLKSEVVTRLSKGQTVTVLEEITRNHSGPSEPSAWAKILLPTNTHVWVKSSYIDATNQTVLARKLNLRSGPGENYSVLGRLKRGDSEIGRAHV